MTFVHNILLQGEILAVNEKGTVVGREPITTNGQPVAINPFDEADFEMAKGQLSAMRANFCTKYGIPETAEVVPSNEPNPEDNH